MVAYIISFVIYEEEGYTKPSMYFVLISVILKHFLCTDHGNLVFPRGYSTDATLLANYWSNPGNQVGTYTGTHVNPKNKQTAHNQVYNRQIGLRPSQHMLVLPSVQSA